MPKYSHSKLQTYERCPLQYKFQYIIKLKPVKQENTVEAFMGGCVHTVFELLYGDLLKTKLNSLEDLIKYYTEVWKAGWGDGIVINNKDFNKQHYFDLGVKCLKNYYEEYFPFDQDQTLGIEKQINLKWGDVAMIGYVDRLAREEKGVYAIHDYKTGSMMNQDYADKDRQLALYSIAVKQTFKEAKKVKLIWHYVAYGEDVISQRTDEELEELKQDILKIIAKINKAEVEDNFPAIETKCEWCGFWEHCPKKKHLYKVKELPKNKYLKDSGVKLANEYAELAEKRAAINKRAKNEVAEIQGEMDKMEEAILKYATDYEIEALQGSDVQVIINKEYGFAFPTKSVDSKKYEELELLLRGTKYWELASTLNRTKLEELLEVDAFDKKLKKKILELMPEEEKTSISIRKNKGVIK